MCIRDRYAFLQERAPQASAAGDAGDGTAQTMGSCEGGAVDASSAPAGSAETVETLGSSERGVDVSSAPTGKAEIVEKTGSCQGGVGASSVPAERAESNPGASAASGTDQENGDVPPAVQSGRAAYELSRWGRLPATVRGRTRGQR